MKVGILTFQYADNYGAVLQAYALKTTIEKKYSSDVKIINYVGVACKDSYAISPFKANNPKTFIKRALLFPLKYVQWQKFRGFRQSYLGIDGEPKGVIKSDEYDLVVVGSDQVWSSPITGGDMNYYIPEITGDSATQKISYAASANDSFPDRYKKEEINRYLLEFRAISVREEQLKTSMMNAYGIHAEVVCDPVFLKTRDEWSEISVKPKGMPPKYILIYMLATNSELDELARRLSEEKGLPICVIHPTRARISKAGKLYSNVGPLEFIWMIANAMYIITNSFHGLAFSTIYSKNVYFARPTGLSNRITSLIEWLGINANEYNENIMYTELRCYDTKAYKEYVEDSLSFIGRNM